jgi:hypothetical protein
MNYWPTIRLAQLARFYVRPRSVNLTPSRFHARNSPLPATLGPFEEQTACFVVPRPQRR